MDLAGPRRLYLGPPSAFSYVSEPTVPFSERDLNDLLLAARRTNNHYGISGTLLVLEDPGNGKVLRFFQWIEGPEEALVSVIRRIEADARHRITDVLWSGPIERRRFRGWDMAFSTTLDVRVYEAAVVEAQR